MHNPFRHLKYLTLLAFFLTQTACATLSGPLSGTVIDKNTSKPIEGAIVVAQWEGSRLHPVDSVTDCFHVETTTTDKDGKYLISAMVGTPLGIVDTQAYVSVVYKEGYREVSYKDSQEPGFAKAPRGVVHLIPFHGTTAQRLNYLMKLSPPCDASMLIELYRRKYSEAQNIAQTKEEKLQALYLLKDIEIATMDRDEAWKRFRERKNNLK